MAHLDHFLVRDGEDRLVQHRDEHSVLGVGVDTRARIAHSERIEEQRGALGRAKASLDRRHDYWLLGI